MNAENAFCIAVENWFLEAGVSYKTQKHNHYAWYKLAGLKEAIILDFLSLPYNKPTETGYHFSLDLFLFHENALKSRILSILHKTQTVFARSTHVQRIDANQAKEFFAENHLSGYAKSKFKYGLEHNGQLVASISFAQGRNIIHEGNFYRSFEMIGFCQKNGITVTGGLSKLLQAFIREKHPEHLSTTVDLDWARGQAFTKIGFIDTKMMSPLPFSVDWSAGTRIFPDRNSRHLNDFDPLEFPYHNSGFQKFELFLK